jgi:hypothetical protein
MLKIFFSPGKGVDDPYFFYIKKKNKADNICLLTQNSATMMVVEKLG